LSFPRWLEVDGKVQVQLGPYVFSKGYLTHPTAIIGLWFIIKFMHEPSAVRLVGFIWSSKL